MFATKSIYALAAGTLLAASMPALAGHDRWEHDRGDRYERSRVIERGHPATREVVIERHVERRVVKRPVYVERPVYHAYPTAVYRQPAYEPAPVYYPQPHERSRAPNVLGTAAGAIVGAAIGSQVGYGHNRAATTAVGAVIGGAIGSQF